MIRESHEKDSYVRSRWKRSVPPSFIDTGSGSRLASYWISRHSRNVAHAKNRQRLEEWQQRIAHCARAFPERIVLSVCEICGSGGNGSKIRFPSTWGTRGGCARVAHPCRKLVAHSAQRVVQSMSLSVRSLGATVQCSRRARDGQAHCACNCCWDRYIPAAKKAHKPK